MATLQEALSIAAVHIQAGRLPEAEQICRQILAAEPSNFDAWHFLGVIARQTGRNDVAVDFFQYAILCEPKLTEAHHNLGNAYKALRRWNEAAEAYRRAIELRPDLVGAQNNLGAVLRELGDDAGALLAWRRALALNPYFEEGHNNIGLMLHDQGSYDEALAHFERALAIKPDFALAHFNLGRSLHEQGHFAAANDCYARAITCDANLAEAHVGAAMLALLYGNFGQGWSQYVWRYRTGQLVERHPGRPPPPGDDLRDRNVLLYAEQGLGDTLQFARYAALVTARGARVVLQCQPGLVSLLRTCAGVDQSIARGGPLPDVDFQASLLSLPELFETQLETVPAEVPYLFAQESLVGHWRNILANVAGFRIGINWQGRPGKGAYRLRDIPLAMFEQLATVPGIELISLQRGEGREELLKLLKKRKASNAPAAHNPQLPLDLGDNVDQTSGAFMDTAAIMKNLDLVITSDTAIAHLAGALAVPVWVALPYVPDWRWLLDRSDSPWYPTMRLFRQPQPGDWESVFQEIHQALTDVLSRRTSSWNFKNP